jgi:hypothetical protein
MQLHILLADAVVHPLQALKRGHDAGFGESGHFGLSDYQETFTPSPESLPSPTIFLISAFSRLSGESP